MAKCKLKLHPRYNVVSIRVSDVELATLERMSREADMSVSDLMRETVLPTGDHNKRVTGEPSK